MHLKGEKFLKKTKSGSHFDYVQCDIEVPESLREAFANFPPIFKNIVVVRDDIGPLMKEHAEKEGLLTQLSRMLKTGYFLENGTVNILLLLCYLDLGLVCNRIYRFVQDTAMNLFNNFVQSAVNATRGWDENPNFGVVAETMKLLSNSFYGYQIIGRLIVQSILVMKKPLQLSRTEHRNAWVISTINCLRWSLSSYKLNTKYR